MNIIIRILFGKETLLDEVFVLNSRELWGLSPELHFLQREPTYNEFDSYNSIDCMVEQVSKELTSFFECLIKVSGGVIGTALSGGYDTRLMLAILRNLDHTPYMYVYGDLNS